MENEIVRDAIQDEIKRLAEIIKANHGCHLEVDSRNGDKWTLYKKKPSWDDVKSDSDAELDAYVEGITLTSFAEFDFPGISGLGSIDPVLYEAMAVALGITLEPEE